MPRQVGLDAPNTLHQVMVRGIERTTVFRDDADRADFVGGGRRSSTKRPAGGGAQASEWEALLEKIGKAT